MLKNLLEVVKKCDDSTVLKCNICFTIHCSKGKESWSDFVEKVFLIVTIFMSLLKLSSIATGFHFHVQLPLN